MADVSIDKQLFECVKIFEVQESSPVAGGETPFNSIDVSPQSSASTTIVNCCFKETRNYTALVLVCDNGYIVLRLELFLQPPIVKQLKWYEGRDQHILDITFDPLGEWLACACLDGCIYLLPVLPLVLPDCSPTHSLGPLTDITIISPSRKISPPTSVVWWESMDGGQICIVGSELGEITFFDLYDGRECGFLSMRGCIDQLLLARKPDHTTHLLMNLRGGEWWWMLLEERHHEDAGASYSDVQESGFEVLLDDVVLRSYLHKPDSPQFEPKLFQGFNELTKLSTQEITHQQMLGALNLKNHNFELFSYDFELFGQCLFKFKIPFNTTSVLWTDKLLFAVNHNDDSDEQSFTLSVISSELAQRNTFQFPENAIVQQFVLHSEASIIGFFTTMLETPKLAKESRDFVTPTNLNGCVIVTSDAVYCCRQLCSPESKFLKMALSTSNLQLTDELAVTFKLDICTLYKVAAEDKIKCGEYNKALRLFEQSKCPALTVISSFVYADRYKELLSFLLSMLYDEDSQTLMSQSKHLQDILVQCLIHQSLSTTDLPSQSAYKEHLSQFINDKFLYNHSLTMQTLIRSGMQTQLFELAQTHGKVQESIEMLIEHGSTELDAPLQTVIANGQFAEVLAQYSQGLLLCMLSPVNFAKCVFAKPSVLEMHLSHLLAVHRDLDVVTLVRLAWLLDPSHQVIHPLLQKSRSTIKRSNSTGSIVSTVSYDGTSTESIHESSGPGLEAYIEAFLMVVITLNNKRKVLPQPSCGLLAQSPMADKVGTSPEERLFRPVTSFSDGSKTLHGTVLSCGLNHGALVINENLYTWGNTRNGKLGHGDIEQQPIAAPLKVETLSMLNAKVISVSCGAEHTIALCQEGVYSWGSSTHGQLGVGDTLKRTRPVPIPSFSNITIISVVCGQYHCLAVDEDRRVWSWGWGIHGQTGTGTTDDQLVPVHAQNMGGLRVSYLAAGFNHSAVIDSKGKLYTFGNAMYGQLGHGSQDKQTTPTLVQALANKYVYLVACGNSHTLAVCRDQSIHYWGKNFHKPHPGSSPQSLRQYARTRREGAVSPAVQNATLPVQLQDTDIDDVIVQIDCGNYHCLVLSASGSVYTWGNNMHGQIGHTHTPELSQPKLVSKLEGHMIKTAACGDEFSIAIDDGGISWVWGRDELGQLGMEFPQGVRERRKVCIFAPNPNPQIPKIITTENHKDTNISDSVSDSLLAIDLQWDLPDFANIDSSDVSYGPECIQAVLRSLHGYYRSSTVMNHCLHLEDYESLSILMTVERQWLEALYYKLQRFSKEQEHLKAEMVLGCVKEYLTAYLDSTPDYHGRDYIIRTTYLLTEIVKFWKSRGLNMKELENLLTEKITELSYPLSMVMKSDIKFSFKFSLAVTTAITNQISLGIPPLEDVVQNSKPDKETPGTEQTEMDSLSPESSYKKHSLRTSSLASGTRLWNEVLRNLSKNIHQHSAVTISESELASIRNFREKNLRTSDKDVLSRKDGIIAFSCGHAFSEIQFQEKILIEFLERVHDFISSMPHMVVFMQQYFKHSSTYTSGCPYCVFQYLRTSELKKNPNTPIRPWSYY